jgi:hypothetical protein
MLPRYFIKLENTDLDGEVSLNILKVFFKFTKAEEQTWYVL